MFDTDKYKEIWQTISRNKRRSILTGFGVLWGIFLYVVMMGIGCGIENYINHAIKDVTQNALFIIPGQTSVEYKGFNSGRRWSITNDDMKNLSENIPEIRYLSGILEMYTENPVIMGEKSGSYIINGIDDNYPKINPSYLEYGRYFNQIDIKEKRKMCIIGSKVYQELFNKGTNPLGTRLAVDGVYYTIVGVIDPSSVINFSGDPASTIFIPSSTFQQVYNYGNAIDFLMIATYDHIEIKQIETQAKAILKAKHFIAPEDDMAILSFDVKRFFLMYKYLFLGLKILIWIVGMGTMLAGVVGVSNIMLVSIKERTQEIGIKRALGAKPGVILRQIMSESMLLTFISGFFGMFLGILILSAVDISLPHDAPIRNPYISFSTSLIASLIILLSGALAGIIPARRALKVKAIDAIRDE